MRTPETVADALSWCPIFRSDIDTDPADAARVRRWGRAGRLVQIAPGSWCDRGRFESLWPEHRHALRAIATVRRLPPDAILSHHSAAAVAGWSVDTDLPRRVQCINPSAVRTRTATRIVVHADAEHAAKDAVAMPEFGLRLTGRDRTALDLARVLPFRHGVAIVDQALRAGGDRQILLDRLEAVGRVHGEARARRAIEFSDAGAANVGESGLRVTFLEASLPHPKTQHLFADGSRRAFVDFWFEDAGVIVEFDGHAKYRDRALLGDRSSAESVIAEKDREDWLRSFPAVKGFVRFGWDRRRDVDFVRGRLGVAGVLPVRATTSGRGNVRTAGTNTRHVHGLGS